MSLTNLFAPAPKPKLLPVRIAAQLETTILQIEAAIRERDQLRELQQLVADHPATPKILSLLQRLGL